MPGEGKGYEHNKGSYSIKAGWIIDGTGAPALRDVPLEIEKGKIVSVGKTESLPPGGADIKDYSRCTILPALVDCHVHLAMSGTEDPGFRQRQLGASFEEIKPVIAENLREHLNHGVIALRDGGDHRGHTFRFKKELINNNKISVPYINSGKAWHAKGRYGRRIGRSPAQGVSLARSVLNESGGTDHIKIIHSGLNSLTTYGLESFPQFDLEQLREAVETGNRLGLKTMVHANGKEAVRTAIEAGCHSIEHGFFMGDENLKRMAEKDVIWVPTLVPMAAYQRIAHLAGRPEGDMAKRNLDHQIQQVSGGMDYGVTIAAGTDAGCPGVFHGRAVGEEIGLLMSAGLSLEKAVQCATSHGAKLLDMEDTSGRIIPGMPASFIVVPGGPDSFTVSIFSPRAVYVEGVPISRDTSLDIYTV